MKKISVILALFVSFTFAFDLGNFAKNLMSDSSLDSPKSSTSGLDNSTISSGLKEALKKGVNFAVSQLGKNNGFLKNSSKLYL